jgi:hypothetical protein
MEMVVWTPFYLSGLISVKLSYDLNRDSKLTYIALYVRSGPYSGSWKEPDFFFRTRAVTKRVDPCYQHRSEGDTCLDHQAAQPAINGFCCPSQVWLFQSMPVCESSVLVDSYESPKSEECIIIRTMGVSLVVCLMYTFLESWDQRRNISALQSRDAECRTF